MQKAFYCMFTVLINDGTKPRLYKNVSPSQVFMMLKTSRVLTATSFKQKC